MLTPLPSNTHTHKYRCMDNLWRYTSCKMPYTYGNGIQLQLQVLTYRQAEFDYTATCWDYHKTGYNNTPPGQFFNPPLDVEVLYVGPVALMSEQ